MKSRKERRKLHKISPYYVRVSWKHAASTSSSNASGTKAPFASHSNYGHLTFLRNKRHLRGLDLPYWDVKSMFWPFLHCVCLPTANSQTSLVNQSSALWSAYNLLVGQSPGQECAHTHALYIFAYGIYLQCLMHPSKICDCFNKGSV